MPVSPDLEPVCRCKIHSITWLNIICIIEFLILLANSIYANITKGMFIAL